MPELYRVILFDPLNLVCVIFLLPENGKRARPLEDLSSDGEILQRTAKVGITIYFSVGDSHDALGIIKLLSSSLAI